ncbi:unnamed protein product (macronuclear) [Paramecium tetraurelia]|uniref:Protein kinase domain-containing protein n=1 Tax=Paramecium tetraurelia TaxID=5888 RepID=A0BSK5_PARTE|nr:uncharacterized protein GSPATT00031754001 [Paramecium tetraurelia]CAK61522.1 unnamed protein product [Paramecium tetraurelia]|eukprot:XP_001428920.1 hypothetical protein (macronuclear) [Paramecium tetraurelia strain d4-2]
MCEADTKIIGKYIQNTKRKLGQGLICSVYEAKYLDTNKYVALKKISRKTQDSRIVSNERLQKSYALEIEILKQCVHKNVISLVDNFETQDHFYIILELCDSNLKEYLEKKTGKRLEEEEAMDIFSQIVEGEKCLHKQKYSHRDIKPENILLKDGCVKITDVNLAKNIEDMYKAAAHSIVGTPIYSAPEINSNTNFCPYKADIYSLGIVLSEMLHGLIDRCQVITNYQNIIKIRSDLEELINRMLEKDPKMRADWSDVSTFICYYKKLNLLDKIISSFSEIQQSIQDENTKNFMYPTGLLIIKQYNKLIDEKTLELQARKKYNYLKDMKQHEELRFYVQNAKKWYENQKTNQTQILCESGELKDELRHSERSKQFNTHFQSYLAAFYKKLNNITFNSKELNFKIKYFQLKLLIACDLICDFQNVQKLLSQPLMIENVLSLGHCLKDIDQVEKYTKALLPIFEEILK